MVFEMSGLNLIITGLDSEKHAEVAEFISRTFGVEREVASRILSKLPVILLDNMSVQEAAFAQDYFEACEPEGLVYEVVPRPPEAMRRITWAKRPRIKRHEEHIFGTHRRDAKVSHDEVEFIDNSPKPRGGSFALRLLCPECLEGIVVTVEPDTEPGGTKPVFEGIVNCPRCVSRVRLFAKPSGFTQGIEDVVPGKEIDPEKAVAAFRDGTQFEMPDGMDLSVEEISLDYKNGSEDDS